MTAVKFISYFSIDIFTTVTVLITAAIVLKIKPKMNLKNIVLLVFQSVLFVLNNYYNFVSIRYLFSIIISTIFTKLVLNIKYEKALTFTILNAALSIIVELFTSLLLINISDINTFNNHILLKIVFTGINNIIVMLIMINKKMGVFLNKVFLLIENNRLVFRYLITIILLLNMFIFLRGLNMQNTTTIFVTTICTFLGILIVRTNISDKYNMRTLEDRNNNLNNLFKANSKTIDQCRELKHNLKNDLYFLKSSIPQKYHKEINELIIKYNKNYGWINQIDEMPEGLQGIIFLKTQEANKHKVDMRISYNKTAELTQKDYLDLSSILGILLDNAIEASKEKRNSVIDVNVKETKSELKVSIINCFKNQVDINKIGKKNYSTKKYKSGIGLDYINKIKNDNIKVSFKIVNNLFISNIVYIQN